MTGENRPTPRPDVVALGGGRYAIVGGEGTRIAYGIADGQRAWIFLDGRTFSVGDARGVRPRAKEDEQTSLAAPMPATVVSVSVAAGDRVSRGDVLLTLEAMKMELPVLAPRDGVIASVACRPGELVQPGLPLVAFR